MPIDKKTVRSKPAVGSWLDKREQKMKVKRGFTLVEILITVVVLGILAATVIPQFSPARTDASTSRLCSDLQTIRVAIELYKVQHRDKKPGTVAGVSFGQALIERTDADGTLNAAGNYGPYVQKMPENPFNELDTIEIDGVVGGGDFGWHFDTTTGQFNADTDGHTGL